MSLSNPARPPAGITDLRTVARDAVCRQLAALAAEGERHRELFSAALQRAALLSWVEGYLGSAAEHHGDAELGQVCRGLLDGLTDVHAEDGDR